VGRSVEASLFPDQKNFCDLLRKKVSRSGAEGNTSAIDYRALWGHLYLGGNCFEGSIPWGGRAIYLKKWNDLLCRPSERGEAKKNSSAQKKMFSRKDHKKKGKKKKVSRGEAFRKKGNRKRSFSRGLKKQGDFLEKKALSRSTYEKKTYEGSSGGIIGIRRVRTSKSTQEKSEGDFFGKKAYDHESRGIKEMA